MFFFCKHDFREFGSHENYIGNFFRFTEPETYLFYFWEERDEYHFDGKGFGPRENNTIFPVPV